MCSSLAASKRARGSMVLHSTTTSRLAPISGTPSSAKQVARLPDEEPVRSRRQHVGYQGLLLVTRIEQVVAEPLAHRRQPDLVLERGAAQAGAPTVDIIHVAGSAVDSRRPPSLSRKRAARIAQHRRHRRCVARPSKVRPMVAAYLARMSPIMPASPERFERRSARRPRSRRTARGRGARAGARSSRRSDAKR